MMVVVVVNVAPSGGTADWSQAAALPPEGWRALRPRTAPGAGSTQPEKGRGGEEGGGKGQPPTPGEYTHRILKPSAPAEPTQGGAGEARKRGGGRHVPPWQPPRVRRQLLPLPAAARGASPSRGKHVPPRQPPGVRRQRWHVPSQQPPGVRRPVPAGTCPPGSSQEYVAKCSPVA